MEDQDIYSTQRRNRTPGGQSRTGVRTRDGRLEYDYDPTTFKGGARNYFTKEIAAEEKRRAAERKRAEEADRLAKKLANTEQEKRFRAADAKFFKADDGNYYQERDERGRPLFNESQWELRDHPEYGKVKARRNRYGETEAKLPDLKTPDSYEDPNLYFEDGTPAGRADELAKPGSPFAEAANEWIGKRKSHLEKTVSGVFDKRIAEANAKLLEAENRKGKVLEPEREKLAAEIAKIENDPKYDDKSGGLFGIGGELTPEARRLARRREQLQNRLSSIDDELIGIESEMDKDGGKLYGDLESAKREKALWLAKSELGEFDDLEAQRVAILESQGVSKRAIREDPILKQIRERKQSMGMKLADMGEDSGGRLVEGESDENVPRGTSQPVAESNRGGDGPVPEVDWTNPSGSLEDRRKEIEKRSKALEERRAALEESAGDGILKPGEAEKLRESLNGEIQALQADAAAYDESVKAANGGIALMREARELIFGEKSDEIYADERKALFEKADKLGMPGETLINAAEDLEVIESGSVDPEKGYYAFKHFKDRGIYIPADAYAPRWMREKGDSSIGIHRQKGWREILESAEESGDISADKAEEMRLRGERDETTAYGDLLARTIYDKTFQRWLRKNRPDLPEQTYSNEVVAAVEDFMETEPNWLGRRWHDAKQFFAGAAGDFVSSTAMTAGFLSNQVADLFRSQNVEAEKNPLYDFGKMMQEHYSSEAYFDPRMGGTEIKQGDPSFMRGLGSTVPFLFGAGYAKMGATAAAKALGMGSKTVATLTHGSVAIMGGGMNAGQMISEAKAFGLTDKEATPVALLGFVAGMSEAVSPVTVWAGRFVGRPAKKKALKFITNMALEAVEEGMQEASVEGMNNLVAGKYYDKGRKFLDGLGESAKLGGEIGAFVSAISQVVAGARVRRFASMATRRNDMFEAGIEAKAEARGMILEMVPEAGNLPEIAESNQSVSEARRGLDDAKTRLEDLQAARRAGVPLNAETIGEISEGARSGTGPTVEAEEGKRGKGAVPTEMEVLEAIEEVGNRLKALDIAETVATSQVAKAAKIEEEVFSVQDIADPETGEAVPGSGENAARGLVAIARGVDPENLAVREQEALRSLELAVGAPVMRPTEGEMVLTDPAREWLRQNVPAARDMVEETERQALERASAAPAPKKPKAEEVVDEGRSASAEETGRAPAAEAADRTAGMETGGETAAQPKLSPEAAESLRKDFETTFTGRGVEIDPEAADADGSVPVGVYATSTEAKRILKETGAGWSDLVQAGVLEWSDDGRLRVAKNAVGSEPYVDGLVKPGIILNRLKEMTAATPGAEKRGPQMVEVSRKIASRLNAAVSRYRPVFDAVESLVGEGGNTGGVQTRKGRLEINVDDLLRRDNFETLMASPERAERIVQEEAIHVVAQRVVRPDQAVGLWRALPERTRRVVSGIYPPDAKQSKRDQDYASAHEFIRMIVQGRLSIRDGVLHDGDTAISEDLSSTDTLTKIRDFLLQIRKYFTDLAGTLRRDGADEATIEAVDAIVTRVEETINGTLARELSTDARGRGTAGSPGGDASSRSDTKRKGQNEADGDTRVPEAAEQLIAGRSGDSDTFNFDGGSVTYRYELVDEADVIEDPRNTKPGMESYDTRQFVEKRSGPNFDARRAYAIDPTFQQGPPMVERENGKLVIKGGHRRTYIRRNNLEAYQSALPKYAKRFGIDPAAAEGMENPVIVAVVQEKLSPGERDALISKLNDSDQQGTTTAWRATALARKMTPEIARTAGDLFEKGGEKTPLEVLQSAEAATLSQEMVDAGVLSDAERKQLVNENGSFTKFDQGGGAPLMKKVLLATVIDDSRTLDRIEGTPLETKLLNGIGQIMTLLDRGQDVGVLRAAVNAEAERLQLNPEPSIEDFQAQQDMGFEETGRSPESEAVHRWLGSFNSNRARAEFADLVARFAPNEDPNQIGMFGENRDIGEGLLEGERGEAADDLNHLVLRSMSASLNSAFFDRRILEIYSDNEKIDIGPMGLPRTPETLQAGHPLLIPPVVEENGKQKIVRKRVAIPPSASIVVRGIIKAGVYTRVEMHEAIIDHFLSKGKATNNPSVLMMAGGGGAGKGTVLKRFLEPEGGAPKNAVHVDPDEIKGLIPEYEALANRGDGRGAFVYHEESSMIAKDLNERATAMRSNIVLDKTLSDAKKAIALVNKYKNIGYNIAIAGVTIDPMEAAIRASKRAVDSFRWVPFDALFAAHQGFSESIIDIAKNVGFEKVKIYDNTTGAREIKVDESGFNSYSILDERAEKAKAARARMVEEVQGGYPALASRGVGKAPQGAAGIGGLQTEPGSESTDVENLRTLVSDLLSGKITPEAALRSQSGDFNQSLRLFSKSASDSNQETLFDLLDGDMGPAVNYAKKTPAKARRSKSAFKKQVAKDVPSLEGNDAALGDLFAFATKNQLSNESGERNIPDKGNQNERVQQSDRSVGQRAERSESTDGGPADGTASSPEGGDRGRGGSSESRPGQSGRPRSDNDGGRERRGSTGDVEGSDGRGEGEVRGSRGEGERLGVGRGGEGDARADAPWSTPLGFAAVPGYNPDALAPQNRDHVIEPDEIVAPSGFRGKFQANVEAIKLLRKLESKNRNPSPDEKKTLARYTGWGWAGESFNPDNSRYADEYAQLREIMDDEEFASARGSTLNAHFTAPQVISGMWKAVERMGFTGGRVLEPAGGVGHFFGLMPPNLRKTSRLDGVELDSLSARIFSKLYPNASVKQQGFEESKIPNNSVDLVISNVPFGNYTLAAKDYPKLLIHDYFFARALDKAKPGGLVAFITSDGTMQKFDSKVRQLLSEKADLVGAIRLPNTAFQENAGTQVTTDIIFLRKRDGNTVKNRPWIDVRKIGTDNYQDKGETVTKDIYINEYFADNPRMALGKHALAGTMYSRGDYALVANPGEDLKTRLEEAVQSLPENIVRKSETENNEIPEGDASEGENELQTYYNPDEDSFYQIIDGSRREPQWMKQKNFGKADSADAPITPKQIRERKEIARDWIKVRDALVDLLKAENTPDVSDGILTAKRALLNQVYDRYKSRYGTLNKKYRFMEKAAFLDEHPDYALIQSIEKEKTTVDSRPLTKKEKERGMAGKKLLTKYTYSKGDIFSERIRQPATPPDRVETASDAVAISRSQHGGIRPEFIAKLLGVSEEEAMRRATEERRAFKDPESGMWEFSENYLSGNVRKKLEAAMTELENGDESMQANVDELTKVIPVDVPVNKISAQMSSRWLDNTILERFMEDRLGTAATLTYSPALGTWTNVDLKGTAQAQPEFGTERMDVGRIVEHAMNGTNPEVYDSWKDSGGKTKRTKNKTATAAAVGQVAKLNKAFQSWVKTTDAIVETEEGRKPLIDYIERRYNDLNNAMVPPSYNGSYLQLPGATKAVYRLPHRLSVIARILNEGSAMMAHGVGSGKTFSIIISSYEMKRLGMASKPMIVVQNATIGQFAASYRQAYPDAKVLVATEKDLTKHYRKRFLNRVSTGNWDAVIVTQSQFNTIGSKIETVKKYFAEQIDTLDIEIRQAKEAEGKRSPTTKQLEAQKKKLAKRLTEVVESLEKRQDEGVMSFEDMGIDALFVDEAHEYKKIPIVTKKKGVKGVPSDESLRAINMELKVRHVQSRTNGRNIVLATGTPITNSMAEAYVMLRLATPKVLEEYGINHFDDFANTFGQTVTKLEYTWKGSWANVTRFNRFVNLPELTAMIRSGFDVKMGNKELGLKVPNMRGNAPELQIVPQNDVTSQFNDWILNIAATYEGLDNQGKKDNSWVPIVTMQAGMAGALDPRLIDPSLPDHPQSKVNQAVRNVLSIYNDPDQGADNKTQMIFADQFLPVNTEKLEAFAGGVTDLAMEEDADAQITEDEDADENESHTDDKESEEAKAETEAYKNSTGFNLYRDIRDKLIEGGIPVEEIAIIHEFKTDRARKDLFDKMNAGAVRVLIGSTAKMGVGVNAHERLYAAHHLDPPKQMTPAMMEQRDGRIIRQGNGNSDVRNIRYGVEKSMDTGIYQLLENKILFIRDALMGRADQRIAGDEAGEASMSMSEMKARLTGDPRIIRKAELEANMAELELERIAWEDEISANIKNLTRLRQNIDYKQTTERPRAVELSEWFQENVPAKEVRGSIDGGRVIEERSAFMKTLERAVEEAAKRADKEAMTRAAHKAVGEKIEKRREFVGAFWNGVPVEFQVYSQIEGETDRQITLVVKNPINPDVTLRATTVKSVQGAMLSLADIRKGHVTRAHVDRIDGELDAMEKRKAPLEKAVSNEWDKADEFDSATRELEALNSELESESSSAVKRPAPTADIDPAIEDADTGEPILRSMAANPLQTEMIFSAPIPPLNRASLVTDNLGLATYHANRFRATDPSHDRDDLIQEARIGLVEAARSYDPDKGVKFSAFASFVIRNKLVDRYRKGDPDGILSMQAPAGEDNQSTLEDVIADRSPSPADQTESSDGRSLATQALDTLSPKVRETVRRRVNGETFESIAAHFGESKQAASKRYDNAIALLQKRFSRLATEVNESPVDENDLDSYVARHGIPENSRSEARESLREAVSLSMREEGQTYLDFDEVSGGVGRTGDRAERSGAARRDSKKPDERDSGQVFRKAFELNTPEAWKEALEAGNGRVTNIVPQLVKSDFRWDVRGALVRDARDAAALGRMLRNPYVESFKFLYVGKDNIVLHSEVASVGGIASAPADPAMLAASIGKIPENVRDEVSGVIILHNHPSGDPGPSGADVSVTRQMRTAGERMNVPVIDHVITNGTSYYSFGDAGILDAGRGNPKKTRRLTPRKKEAGIQRLKELGVTEGELAEWEIVPRELPEQFTDAAQVFAFKKTLGQGLFGIYLNRKNRIMGVEQYDPSLIGGNSSGLAELTRKVADGMGRNAAVAFVLSGHGGATMEGNALVPAMRAIRTMFKEDFGGIYHFLDVINDKGADFDSFKTAGILEEGADYNAEPGLSSQSADRIRLTNEALERRSKGEYEIHPTDRIIAELESILEQAGNGRGSDTRARAIGLRRAFQAAEDVARRGARSVSPAERLPSKEPIGFNRRIAKGESQALRKWVRDNGFIRSYADFEAKWKAGGEQRGVEHRVYFDPESRRYFKLTNRPNNNTWVEYFQRMQIHNTLFPDTAYRLEGVAFSPRGEMFIEVSQEAVVVGEESRQVSEAESFRMMQKYGFVPAGNEDAYYHKALGLWIGDLHPGNILRQENTGALMVIDPVIEVARKGQRGAFEAENYRLSYPEDDSPVLASQASGQSGSTRSPNDLSISDLRQLAFLEDWAAARGVDSSEIVGDEREMSRAANRWNQAHPDLPPLDQRLLSRAAGSDEQTVMDLMDLLNEMAPDTDAYVDEAMNAPEGAKPGGRPDLANPAGASEYGRKRVDAMDEAMKGRQMAKDTDAILNEKARNAIETDEIGVKRDLLEAANDPDLHGLLPAWKIKAAQMLVEKYSRREAANPTVDGSRELDILIYVSRIARGDVANSMRAMRDTFRTPAERHREFLSRAFRTPSKKEQKAIEKLPTPAQKSREVERIKTELKKAIDEGTAGKEELRKLRVQLDEARNQPDRVEKWTEVSSKRLKRIEDALLQMGVTLEDIFSGETEVRLKVDNIVSNYSSKLDEKRKTATDMLYKGMRASEIRKKTGLSQGDLNDLVDDFEREFMARHRAKYMAAAKGREPAAGNSAASQEVMSLLRSMPSNPDANEAEIERIAVEAMKRDLEKMGFGKGLRNRSIQADMKRKSGLTKRTKQAKGEKRFEQQMDAPPEGRPPMWDEQAKDRHHPRGAQRNLTDPDGPPDLDMGDPVTATTLARVLDAIDSNGFDVAYEWWINSILSGPQTQIVNIVGNTLNAGLDMTIQRGMEASLNLFLSKIGQGDPRAAQFGEFAPMMRAILPGMSEGLRLAAKSFAAETDLFKNRFLGEQIKLGGMGRIEDNYRKAIGGSKGRVVRLPGRTLLFFDVFMKSTVGRIQAAAEAYRIARNEKLTGDALQARITELMEPESEAWELAVDRATELAFQSEGDPDSFGGKVLSGAMSLRDTIPGARYVIPFLRTIWNIFAMGVRKSPVGMVNLLGRVAKGGVLKLKDGQAFSESYPRPEFIRHASEQILAGLATAMLWGAAEGDEDDEDKWLLITGSRPSGTTKYGVRKLYDRAGIPEYTVRVKMFGKEYMFQYGRYEPVSTVLGISTDTIRTVKQSDKLDGSAVIGSIISAVGDQVESKTFARGISDIMKTMDDPSKAVDWASNFATSWVPNILRQPVRLADPMVREYKIEAPWKDLPGRFMEKTVEGALPFPGLRPVDISIWGEEVEKQGNAVSRILIPQRAGEVPRVNRVDRMLLNWNQQNPSETYAPQPPSRTFVENGERLTMNDEEFIRYQKARGKMAFQRLSATALNIANPTERDLDKVRDALSYGHTKAKQLILRERRAKAAAGN